MMIPFRSSSEIAMKLLLAVASLLALPHIAVAQPNFPTPKTFPPNEAMLKRIAERTAELDKAIQAFQPTKLGNFLEDVDIYLKAAQWMQKHGEWFTDKTAQQTLDVLNNGMLRVKGLNDKEVPWLATRGKPIALAYCSMVDGSIQPYSLQFPANYDPKKKYRLDVVLHGRDGTISEVKFIHGKDSSKGGTPPDYFVLEAYGRGNNAYRWSGEADVIESIENAIIRTGGLESRNNSSIDLEKIVLRGFSMGGAGTWHFGLHHPTMFAVMGPGAGFTTTHGYIGNLPKELPDYIEKCLRIYDAKLYAENAFNIPVVAYSGEKDPQKKAADIIEAELKNFKEPHSFTHIIAPGLEHKQPPEWFKKCDEEYRKHVGKKPETPERIRFVTYTTKYPGGSWAVINGLEKQYEKAVLDAIWNKDGLKATTQNISRVGFNHEMNALPEQIIIDGQTVKPNHQHDAIFEKIEGKWQPVDKEKWLNSIVKRTGIQGPIDDAFALPFTIVRPSAQGYTQAISAASENRRETFEKLWSKFFRGELASVPADKVERKLFNNLILFGDPKSNPLIAKVLPKLPIQWNEKELIVNGVTYDAKTHFPVMIYPNPENVGSAIVLNSGHTFGEADLRGTNALLYPRLGDWAVLKLAPTKTNPHATEVVAAGLFDENWQFPKK